MSDYINVALLNRNNDSSATSNQQDVQTDAEEVLGEPYATNAEFWQYILGCTFFGAVMGLIAYAYLFSIEKIQEKWLGEDYMRDYETMDFLGGKPYWIAITTGSGLLVGIIKILIDFPLTVNGFFKEVKEQYVERGIGMKLLLASWLSLLGGASLGPEAAIGSLGGGLGRMWSERSKATREVTERNVVNGMSAAMGALFPNPIVAVSCMLEVGKVESMHKNYMATVAMMTTATCCSFIVYFALQNKTYLPFNPLVFTYQFEVGDVLKAILIGVFSGFIGLIHIVVFGVCKRCFKKIQQVIKNDRLFTIVSPVLGGLMIGGIYVVLPLTIGSGTLQTEEVTKARFKFPLLFASAFGKSFAFGISASSGFIGGNLFPMLFIGAAFGAGAFDLIGDKETLPLLLSVGCFMAGVPASITPLPFTIILLIAFSLQLGQYQATPIFVSCISAHLTTCGFGVVLYLLRRTRS